MEQLIKRYKYKGFDYLIAKNSFGNYNGYFINLTDEQFKQLNDVEYLIHGGITLTASYAKFDNGYVDFIRNNYKDTVIGFDTMHVNDFFNAEDMISKWMPQDVENNIKEVIDYIK